MKTIYIYGLTDPRNGSVRYIGKTVNTQKRLWHHIYLARTGREDTYKARWIRQLLLSGMEPGIKVLTTTDENDWQQEERRWIAESKDLLTNSTAGGDGVDAPRTETWKKRIGDAHRGKEISPELREKLRETQLAKRGSCCKTGHEFTPENTATRRNGNNEWRTCRQCEREYRKQWREDKGLVKGRKKQLCCQGHPLEGDNLRILVRRGREERICRECVRIRNKKSKQNTITRALARQQPVKHKPDTHCKYGHQYNEDNAGYTKHGYRYCKECQRQRLKNRRNKNGD